MNSRIQTQADKLRQLVFSPTTADAYRQAIALTWTILKETGLLLWLVICLVLVVGDWFWKASYETGLKARVWVNNRQNPSEDSTAAQTGAFRIEDLTSGDFWSATGQSLLESGKSAATAALTTAKGQLGIEVQDDEAPQPKLTVVKADPVVEPTLLEPVADSVTERPDTDTEAVQPGE